MTTTLEELLRASQVHTGTIALLRIDGGPWRATVSHHNGHMVHPMGDWAADPVDALRSALIEDDRRHRDVVRRYATAPKQVDLEEAIAVAAAMDDLIG